MQINQLIRSKRRTLSLQVIESGQLIVRAPLRMSMADIEAFIAQKQRWILRHQQSQQAQIRAPKQFISGEQFLYLGAHYPLQIVAEGKEALHFDNGFYLQEKYLPKAERLFQRWYQAQALILFPQRVAWYAGKAQLFYNQIKINSAQRQWGACSAENNLSFTWRLMMAPLSAIDYVVAHEVAHIRYKSHGVRFWQLVEKLYPDFKKERRWLKQNDYLLRNF